MFVSEQYSAETGKIVVFLGSCICFFVLSLKLYCRDRRGGLADGWWYPRECWRNTWHCRASPRGCHHCHWRRLGETRTGNCFGNGGDFGRQTGEEAGGGAVCACRRWPWQWHHQQSCSSIPQSRPTARPDGGGGNIAVADVEQDFGCRSWRSQEDNGEDWRGCHGQHQQRGYGCHSDKDQWESFYKEVGVWCWLGATSEFAALRVCPQVPLQVTTWTSVNSISR